MYDCADDPHSAHIAHHSRPTYAAAKNDEFLSCSHQPVGSFAFAAYRGFSLPARCFSTLNVKVFMRDMTGPFEREAVEAGTAASFWVGTHLPHRRPCRFEK